MGRENKEHRSICSTYNRVLPERERRIFFLNELFTVWKCWNTIIATVERMKSSHKCLWFTVKSNKLQSPIHSIHKSRENVPVEGQSWHAGAAAVVAQTCVHPSLGKDDINLVLLVKERKKERVDIPIWTDYFFTLTQRKSCVKWSLLNRRLHVVLLEELIMCLRSAQTCPLQRLKQQHTQQALKHINTLAFDMGIEELYITVYSGTFFIIHLSCGPPTNCEKA